MKMRLVLMSVALLAALPVQAQLPGGGDGAEPQSSCEPAPETPSARPKAQLRDMTEMLVDYPYASVRAREQGEVLLSLCVSADGRVSDPKIIKSSGHPRLDKATLDNIVKVRFSPAKDACGKPVAWCDPPYQMSVVWSLPGL